jgi:hypothetical protein
LQLPSAALTYWKNDRAFQLNEVEAHCAAAYALVPPNPTFFEETVRGFVLHLSAHFQGYFRDLYTECAPICIAAMPAGLQAVAQSQFLAQLALEKGNPNHDNKRKDFNRFGFQLNLQSANSLASHQLADLAHLNAWRNKAAHQGTQPMGASVPATLTLGVVQVWRASCDGLAGSLDQIMQQSCCRFSGRLLGDPGREILAMTTPNLTEPLKEGTVVKILRSGFDRAVIVEYRGPLGPKGARIYRVGVRTKPRPMYLEVREDQLEVLEVG